MIYTERKWQVEYCWTDVSSRGFVDKSLCYITNTQELDEYQLEHARRIKGYTGFFAGRTFGQTVGTTAFGGGASWAFIATSPTNELLQNGMFVTLGGMLTLIAGAFGFHGLRNGKRAYRELRAQYAKPPANVKQFELSGPQWDMLKEALETLEREEIAEDERRTKLNAAPPLHLKAQQVPKVFGKIKQRAGRVRDSLEQQFQPPEQSYDKYDAGRIDSDPHKHPVLWHVFMTALEEHGDLGRYCDLYISQYLLGTEDIVTQMTRSDQSKEWSDRLEATLRNSAYTQMVNVYKRLTEQRDLEGFKPGEMVTAQDYLTLRTRSEAALAAEMAIATAEPLTYSLPKELQ